MSDLILIWKRFDLFIFCILKRIRSHVNYYNTNRFYY